jgi:hypothetical protein
LSHPHVDWIQQGIFGATKPEDRQKVQVPYQHVDGPCMHHHLVDHLMVAHLLSSSSPTISHCAPQATHLEKPCKAGIRCAPPSRSLQVIKSPLSLAAEALHRDSSSILGGMTKVEEVEVTSTPTKHTSTSTGLSNSY